MTQLKPLRGKIWMFDLDPRRGREQRGVRPCLVISSNALNRSSFGTLIICPITSRERPGFKWRVGLRPEDLSIADADWYPRPHWVETDQIVTVNTARRTLRHLATIISEEKIAAISAARSSSGNRSQLSPPWPSKLPTSRLSSESPPQAAATYR